MTPDSSNNSHSKPSARGKAIRLRILRSTAVLPAAFTLLNGLAGFAAIHFATKHDLGASLNPDTAAGAAALFNLNVAAMLLFVAMICDMLDGRLARMTRTTSDFGAQLDSLCDMISFGVAPAVLAVRCSISILREQSQNLPVERAIWCIAGIYIACAALRLARFNVETDQDEAAHMDFRGLPSPGAAGMLMAMVLLFVNLIEKNYAWLPADDLLLGMSVTLPILTLAAALLMVSRFRYPHIVNQYIRGRKPFSYLVKLVIIILAACIQPFITLAAVALIYTFSGPVRACWLMIRHRKPAAA
ncbi:MAG: phosphatidylcholine/phosphatidylserine synthase [Phycisphaerae bacterium]|nr:phosphatidylcholine/phosphatidylserine synthase [Phycisphaerae bacterium]